MSCYAVSSIGSTAVTATSWIARQSAGAAAGSLFMASFEAIEHHHAQVVIYRMYATAGVATQVFLSRTVTKQQRKMWSGRAQPGHRRGLLPAPDLDVDLVYRFIP